MRKVLYYTHRLFVCMRAIKPTLVIAVAYAMVIHSANRERIVTPFVQQTVDDGRVSFQIPQSERCDNPQHRLVDSALPDSGCPNHSMYEIVSYTGLTQLGGGD